MVKLVVHNIVHKAVETKMEFVRVGDKLVNLHKVDRMVRQIFALRSEGLSQQEVADRLRLDRTFISRLETLGSVRRGGRIGLIAFPVSNKAELEELAARYGIESTLILSNRERWQMVEKVNGLDFLNKTFAIIEEMRQCDTVLVFCSTKWNRLAVALLDNDVITVEIGKSPMTEDVYVNPQTVESVLQPLVAAEAGESKR